MTQNIKKLSWRLDELLLERNAMSGVQLANLLQKDGGHIVSRVQVSRLIRAAPQLVPLSLLDALCRTLDCSPNELLGWQGSDKTEHHPLQRALQRQLRKQAEKGEIPSRPDLPEQARELTPEERARVVGPSIRAMPAHPHARSKKSSA